MAASTVALSLVDDDHNSPPSYPPTTTDGTGEGYTSTFSIPYGPSSLQTLDLHTRSIPPSNRPSRTPGYGYWIIFVHGGALRDPLTTSLSILPSLPALFALPNVEAVVGVNYRLSAYPRHRTQPSNEGVKWPVHFEDVRRGVGWVWGVGGMKDAIGRGGRGWVMVGHSVGGTMSLLLASASDNAAGKEGRQGEEAGEGVRDALSHLKAVVSVAGIYDFPLLLRNAQQEQKAEYEEFIEAAFGGIDVSEQKRIDRSEVRGDSAGEKATKREQESTGYEVNGHIAEGGQRYEGAPNHAKKENTRGYEAAKNAPSLLTPLPTLLDNVEAVVVAHSRGDELVEWEQGRRMVEGLTQGKETAGVVEKRGEALVKEVEIQGGHEDILDTGRMVDVVKEAWGVLESGKEQHVNNGEGGV